MSEADQDGKPAAAPSAFQLMADPAVDPHSVALSEAAQELGQLLMPYRFGLEEMQTKINILREELSFRPEGSPIEHVSSRLKSIDSIRAKASRIGCEFTPEAIAHQIFDIAGIRIVCSFIEDAYWVLSMLTSQSDVTVIEIKDYIANPKPNGYRSLHAIVQIRCSCPTRSARCASSCRSGRSPWTSGRASSTRSTTSSARRSRSSSATSWSRRRWWRTSSTSG